MRQFSRPLLAVCVCVLLLSGCGLFTSAETREAEILYARARALWMPHDDVLEAMFGEKCSDPESAIDLLNRAIALKPDHADAYMFRGLAHLQEGDGDKAMADLNQAIRLHPRPDRYTYLGIALLIQGNLEDARRNLDQSIAMDKSQSRAWNLRGYLNSLEDRNEEACADVKTGCANGDCLLYDLVKEGEFCR
jgi:tetratricopeptide (TPR) repeat protein